jgi:hypothetical protein
MPAPAVRHDSLIGYQGRAEAGNPPDLSVHVGRAQVQVQPVLLVLALGHLLQQHLDALPVSGTRLRYGPLVARLAVYPSTPAQNRAERARSEHSMTTTSSPFR